ncbi:phytoene desaturase family protein [Pseudactinotalea sp.]|uniref:phytoene desaturase family protein n=1 Tax=Pseudactinotalea sp. TaxID=1926260 RepID=UPI003B3AEB82
MKIAIIGGGITGLSTAALLAADGHDVELFEARDALGGRAGSWAFEGFRFDTGPSWFLMPEVFEHFYRLLGTTTADQLDLVRLDPGYRVFFESGAGQLDLGSDRECSLAAFEQVEPGSRARMERYLDSARETYRLALDHFLYDDFASPRGLLRWPELRRAHRLLRLLTEPLAARAARTVTDPRLQPVLGYPAVFLGTSPYRAPSMYHLMSHLDLEDGVFYPMGGFTAVVEDLARLAEARGAVLRTGAPVGRITVSDGVATGLDVSDGSSGTRHVRADIVVSAADLHHTEQRLLAPEHRTRSEASWRRADPGPSAVLAMLGVRGALPRLPHHSLAFTNDWRENFGAIEAGRVPDPASVYVCRPSATDRGVAPAGHENLFVLVPVPADTGLGHGGIGGAGDPRVEQIADAAIANLATWTGERDLADRVVLRRTVGPADFADDLGSWRGSALGPAHVLRQSAFLRGRIDNPKVRGLLHAGATTIPGIGVPMCLISAELIAKRVRGQRGGGRLPEPARSSVRVGGTG